MALCLYRSIFLSISKIHNRDRLCLHWAGAAGCHGQAAERTHRFIRNTLEYGPLIFPQVLTAKARGNKRCIPRNVGMRSWEVCNTGTAACDGARALCSSAVVPIVLVGVVFTKDYCHGHDNHEHLVSAADNATITHVSSCFSPPISTMSFFRRMSIFQSP